MGILSGERIFTVHILPVKRDVERLIGTYKKHPVRDTGLFWLVLDCFY